MRCNYDEVYNNEKSSKSLFRANVKRKDMYIQEQSYFISVFYMLTQFPINCVHKKVKLWRV